MNAWFAKFAAKASNITGSSWAFLAAVVIIAVWAVSGPLFNFSDTWQLIINTFTTLVTFLMVFLIQNTQNRDARALHLKLDEIIHAISAANNRLIEAEDLSDEELRQLTEVYRNLSQREGNASAEKLLQKILSESEARQGQGAGSRPTANGAAPAPPDTRQAMPEVSGRA